MPTDSSDTMVLSIHAGEERRLAALYDLSILDTAPEPLYDDIVSLAAVICGTEIAVINFIDHDRQWGKACFGLKSSETPREHSFCSRTIAQPDRVLIAPDTLDHPEFAANPMVVGVPHLRFYAGVAVVSDEGHAFGAVCVADRAPQQLDEDKRDALHALARQAAAHLQTRRHMQALAEANRQLHGLATRDSLTGIANRGLLLERLDYALAHIRRYGGHCGVIVGDVDSFKSINDSYGHRAGDQVLQAVGQRLAHTVREVDTVARSGGDEFVVDCPNLAHPDDLHFVAARISDAVAQPVRLSTGETIVPQLSLGAALTAPGDTAESAVHRADDAMYQAKRALSHLPAS